LQWPSLLLATGQLCRHPVEHLCQVENLCNLHHPLLYFIPGHARHLKGGGDVVKDGKGGIVDELLVHHGNASFSYRHPGDIFVVHENGSPGGPIQSCHDAQQRRFPVQGSAKDYCSGS
jgi:hypothetical protein